MRSRKLVYHCLTFGGTIHLTAPLVFDERQRCERIYIYIYVAGTLTEKKNNELNHYRLATFCAFTFSNNGPPDQHNNTLINNS